MRKVVHGFTLEEQIELLKNPYTRSVSEWMIKFTDEFNDLFIKRHSQGVGPSRIFSDCGYNLEILGSKRIVNYYNRLQRTYRFQNQVHQSHLENSSEEVNKDYKSLPPSLAIDAMQHEIIYLRQELDFLKKIISVMNKKREA